MDLEFSGREFKLCLWRRSESGLIEDGDDEKTSEIETPKKGTRRLKRTAMLDHLASN
jgi:hypothetical protein